MVCINKTGIYVVMYNDILENNVRFMMHCYGKTKVTIKHYVKQDLLF